MEQSQIYNEFWEMCNDFKNKTNMTTNYMEYISALLYIRYYKNEDENDFKNIYNKRDNFYISKIIDETIKEMKEMIKNNKIFSDIQFSNIVFYRKLGEKNILTITIEKIEMLCKKFSKKYIAEAYEFAIKQLAINKDIKRTESIFYTPEEIVNLMGEMILNKKNAEVYDPICSSGNFLIMATKRYDEKIYGKEENIEFYNILKTRILLNEIKQENIAYQEDNKLNDMKFDYIFSNPPFSQRKWKQNIINTKIFKEYGLSETAVADYAYVLEMKEKLKNNGKMAVILPHGVLFRANEKEVRKKLIEKNEIEAIIGLPENLFYDTRIPVIILILSKNKKKDTILFIDASNDFETEKSNNILAKQYQDKIIDVYKNNKEIKGYSRNVSIKEIQKNDYNLTIKKYIRNIIKKETVEETELIKKLNRLEDEKDILEQNIKDILNALDVKYFEEEIIKEKNNNNKYNIEYKKIGRNIKEVRMKKGYTQEQLSEKMDISARYISRIEQGMAGIRLELLAKICNILDVSIEEIV